MERKYKTLGGIIGQLYNCNFQDPQGHRLESNAAFIALEEMARAEDQMESQRTESELRDTHNVYVSFCNKLDSANTKQGSAEVWDRLRHHHIIKLLHAAMGLVTESGELMDAVKKYAFYDKPLDWDNIREEAGDVLWYVSLIADILNMPNFDPLMEANMEKLRKRYKGDTFNKDGAINRYDKQEEKCPRCLHRAHPASGCLNAESDDYCTCHYSLAQENTDEQTNKADRTNEASQASQGTDTTETTSSETETVPEIKNQVE